VRYSGARRFGSILAGAGLTDGTPCALQSSVKNWQPSGSRFSQAMLCIVAMKFRSAFAVSLLLCFAIERSHADIFAWTYTTELTTKGEIEFEQWVTTRWQKEHGNYEVVDFREEL
jgi:hypothetical protein